MEIHHDTGLFTWTPKIVIYEGKKYKAPLNVLTLFTIDVIKEFLEDKHNNKI